MKTSTTNSPEQPQSFKKAAYLAAKLGVHKKTIFRWADSGLIHRHKLGARLVVFDEQEVQRFVEQSRDR